MMSPLEPVEESSARIQEVTGRATGKPGHVEQLFLKVHVAKEPLGGNIRHLPSQKLSACSAVEPLHKVTGLVHEQVPLE